MTSATMFLAVGLIISAFGSLRLAYPTVVVAGESSGA